MVAFWDPRYLLLETSSNVFGPIFNIKTGIKPNDGISILLLVVEFGYAPRT